MNEKREKITAYTVLTIIAIIFVLPLAWVILASFDKNASLAASLPDFTGQNYMEVLTNSANLRSFGNGLVLSLGVSVLVVICSMLAAYPSLDNVSVCTQFIRSK